MPWQQITKEEQRSTLGDTYKIDVGDSGAIYLKRKVGDLTTWVVNFYPFFKDVELTNGAVSVRQKDALQLALDTIDIVRPIIDAERNA